LYLPLACSVGVPGNPDVRSKAGQTALGLAAARGDDGAIKLLVQEHRATLAMSGGAPWQQRIDTTLGSDASRRAAQRDGVQTLFSAQRLRQALGLGRQLWVPGQPHANEDGESCGAR
jgi:hypothetical protein